MRTNKEEDKAMTQSRTSSSGDVKNAYVIESRNVRGVRAIDGSGENVGFEPNRTVEFNDRVTLDISLYSGGNAYVRVPPGARVYDNQDTRTLLVEGDEISPM